MVASTKIFLAFRLKIGKIDRKAAAVDDRDVQTERSALRAPQRSSRNAPRPATFAKRRDFIKR